MAFKGVRFSVRLNSIYFCYTIRKTILWIKNRLKGKFLQLCFELLNKGIVVLWVYNTNKKVCNFNWRIRFSLAM